MEVHQLRYFLAVAQAGSFTAAAAACNVSQPTLSAQVAKLEDELGGLLIERGRHGAKLTARGELFRGRAAGALHQLALGRSELEELDGLKRGTVTLGCLPTTGAHLLPLLLPAFRSAYPGIRVNLREESSPGLARALHDGEVELAITDEAGAGAGIATEILFSEDLLIAVPAGHQFAGWPEIDLKDLAGQDLVVMKQGHGFRSIMLDALQRAGVQPRIVYESAEIETVQSLVAAGLGVSMIPEIVRKQPGPVYLSIRPPRPSRTILIAWREGTPLSPAALAMKETAITCLGGRNRVDSAGVVR